MDCSAPEGAGLEARPDTGGSALKMGNALSCAFQVGGRGFESRFEYELM
jgi:hypothetical protein